MRKLTTEKFIEKAKKLYGDRYDYSLVNYIGANKKIKIICKVHGVFEQKPSSHLSGKNCIKCGIDSKRSTDFIEKSIKTHGNRYDYSLVDYKNNITKVKIICKEHGVFEQIPKSHLFGRGCPSCSGNKKLTTEEFIEKAIDIHGDKYDYSLVEYKNTTTKIKIICEEHGVFEQTPDNHINKKTGCPKCANNVRFTTEEFIEKANKKHDLRYNYSLVDYKNANTKVKITCSTHGIFEQVPYEHLTGNGCPKCRLSKKELLIEKYLKDNNIEYESQKRFDDCRNIKPLPFDFYLPLLNMCVEYDGAQHFKSVEYWNGDEGLKYRQENDLIKTKYCNDNGIDLLRIRYDENILEKLDLEFNI